MRILTLIFTFFIVPVFVFAQIDPSAVGERKFELEEELKKYESQINEYQILVSQKQQESNSLKRDIEILNAKISSAKLAIKARDITISKLNLEINQKSKNIVFLESESEKTKSIL